MQSPLKDLRKVAVTDGLLEALQLLARRSSSFVGAVQMVLRLAAVAKKEGSPPIVILLRQLFQVALAGTQADDRSRREALTEALADQDPRVSGLSETGPSPDVGARLRLRDPASAEHFSDRG
jgi:hypothetical protein